MLKNILILAATLMVVVEAAASPTQAWKTVYDPKHLYASKFENGKWLYTDGPLNGQEFKLQGAWKIDTANGGKWVYTDGPKVGQELSANEKLVAGAEGLGKAVLWIIIISSLCCIGGICCIVFCCCATAKVAGDIAKDVDANAAANRA